MPSYTLDLIETVRVRRVFRFEFETCDQAKWDVLRATAQKSLDETDLIDVADISPAVAPADPDDWLRLAYLVTEPSAPFLAVANPEFETDDAATRSVAFELSDSRSELLFPSPAKSASRSNERW